ncbi:MAG: ABC transporter, partial [uncultured Sphingomonadaceae bacterium]
RRRPAAAAAPPAARRGLGRRGRRQARRGGAGGADGDLRAHPAARRHAAVQPGGGEGEQGDRGARRRGAGGRNLPRQAPRHARHVARRHRNLGRHRGHRARRLRSRPPRHRRARGRLAGVPPPALHLLHGELPAARRDLPLHRRAGGDGARGADHLHAGDHGPASAVRLRLRRRRPGERPGGPGRCRLPLVVADGGHRPRGGAAGAVAAPAPDRLAGAVGGAHHPLGGAALPPRRARGGAGGQPAPASVDEARDHLAV